ncbi:MAG: hypothetical protein GX174_01485 [Lentisphaerae bacterium]|nr:hypothetical protein [Lentisphaerota bacterium]
MPSPRQIKGINLLLATLAAGLAVALFLRNHDIRQASDAGQTVPDADATTAHVPARRVIRNILPAGFGRQPARQAHPPGAPLHHACKSAIRLTESPDAFLLSLALRDLATNTVDLQLHGSRLSIYTSHRLPGDAIVRKKNCIMLPAAVVTNPAPAYRLTNDLLQISICKRSAMH